MIEFSHFSFGGEVPILIKLKGKDVSVVEGMGTAPLKATREFFVNRTRMKDEGRSTAPDSAKAQSGNADMPTMAGAKSGMIPSTGPLAATVPAGTTVVLPEAIRPYLGGLERLSPLAR